MAYYNPYQYLDYNPADACPQLWTYKKVSFVASLSLIFLLITVSLRPWTFLFTSMVAASLTMSSDYEGAFMMDYFWRLITIVTLVFLFLFLIWCAQKVKRPRSRSNETEDEDEGEDDESLSVYVSLGLIAIFAMVLTWCVQKLQRPKRRRGI